MHRVQSIIDLPHSVHACAFMVNELRGRQTDRQAGRSDTQTHTGHKRAKRLRGRYRSLKRPHPLGQPRVWAVLMLIYGGCWSSSWTHGLTHGQAQPHTILRSSAQMSQAETAASGLWQWYNARGISRSHLLLRDTEQQLISNAGLYYFRNCGTAPAELGTVCCQCL